MPKYCIVGPLGPEAMDFGLVEGESPLLALRNLHHECTSGCSMRNCQLVFADARDQELCAGVWRVVECGRNSAASENRFLIPGSSRAAA